MVKFRAVLLFVVLSVFLTVMIIFVIVAYTLLTMQDINICSPLKRWFFPFLKQKKLFLRGTGQC